LPELKPKQSIEELEWKIHQLEHKLKKIANSTEHNCLGNPKCRLCMVEFFLEFECTCEKEVKTN